MATVEAAQQLYRLQGDEIATGWVSGLLPPPPRAFPPGAAPHPRRVLEDALIADLSRTPCVIAFSGGRDSSALLAVATMLARREGLPDPVPVTHVFPQQAHTDDEQMQEALVGHLQLRDWTRIPVTDEHDLLGPRIAPKLEALGLVHPIGAHNLDSLYEPARGGVLVTGDGGDETLGAQRVTQLLHLWRRRFRPVGKSLRVSMFTFGPAPVRKRMIQRYTTPLPWLRREVAERSIQAMATEAAHEPIAWPRAKRALLRRRGAGLGVANIRMLAAAESVTLSMPFLDAPFVEAVGEFGGSLGYPSRTALMHALFDDVLPHAVVERTTKAVFNDVVFGPNSRAFAEAWDGTGLDAYVDQPALLREEWLSPQPDSRTHALLVAAWLACGAPRANHVGAA